MEKTKNNETFGMSVEKSLCEIYKLDNDIEEKRVDRVIVNEINVKLKKYLDEKKIKLSEYIGGGGYQDDFMLEDGRTLQVKTNFNNSDKVCPPKIGQCTKRTFLNIIAKKINKDIELENEYEIKKFIILNKKEILKLYIEAYYTSDLILYIKKPKNQNYFITIYDKINFDLSILDNCEITFTKNLESWNESSTMKIKYENVNYSIGEYQIHSNRDGVKFRFNRNNFHNLMEKINENKVEIIKELENEVIEKQKNIKIKKDIIIKELENEVKEKPKDIKIKKNKSTKNIIINNIVCLM